MAIQLPHLCQCFGILLRNYRVDLKDAAFKLTVVDDVVTGVACALLHL